LPSSYSRVRCQTCEKDVGKYYRSTPKACEYLKGSYLLFSSDTIW